MRWSGLTIDAESTNALPGLAKLSTIARSVTTPEFAGITFHEVLARTALNRVPGPGPKPIEWTINPYRGCSHACRYCFARPTHEYLDLDAGHDFDSQIVVKVNIVDVLRAELAKASWAHARVSLGTNTDPYQRAEGRYRLMPGIVEALASSGTPIALLTKGTLLRRDLPVLADAAAAVPVSVALSIAVFDDDLQQSLEPGTPSTAARLATVTAVRDAGLECDVLVAPILPDLTDSIAQLDAALERVAAAGATAATWTCLHLKPGVREWFFAWIDEHRPDLSSRYRALYSTTYAPKAYREWLARRIRPLLVKHGLSRRRSGPLRAGPDATAFTVPTSQNGPPTLF